MERCTKTPSPDLEAYYFPSPQSQDMIDDQLQLQVHLKTLSSVNVQEDKQQNIKWPEQISERSQSENKSVDDCSVGSGEKKWEQEEKNDRSSSGYDIGQLLFKNLASDCPKQCAIQNKLDDLNGRNYPFTITSSGEIERTYDEPCVDIPRNRSWLCCPGSRLLGPHSQTVTNTTSEMIITTPPITLCSQQCVC